ncbi:hypothetical protein F441_17523 [Phytophthora nicotianae CJ01A1]|uniref:Uncharacterized protein n=6 Tax=Phytophthora nicotianae TaxID=4792 RepID=W2R1V0_PHYN3|nr:hypothetical protein PPTG_21561 [Phytophthora nicotianae INRA-310]ETI36168.1 hypothetical protein F443_17656 [Phytophthora nicotianae P1569]ETK76397.1 hypothetical protein L915_17190 [Phytophthora nicotianae]ETO64893.1 hypothetical protein F444_17695 [Phytophthora nicotianae P1976]ETP05992.1 hypothetical protein F441_17523 [Phytophthora nicotianae CJ01A1]ETP34102.1 hypothetical protein F442_17508 [Phytophthora nicotianae P10297]
MSGSHVYAPSLATASDREQRMLALAAHRHHRHHVTTATTVTTHRA